MTGALATVMDDEDKGFTLGMVEGAWVPEVCLEQQPFPGQTTYLWTFTNEKDISTPI